MSKQIVRARFTWDHGMMIAEGVNPPRECSMDDIANRYGSDAVDEVMSAPSGEWTTLKEPAFVGVEENQDHLTAARVKIA